MLLFTDKGISGSFRNRENHIELVNQGLGLFFKVRLGLRVTAYRVNLG